ncbi:MAG: hypothetical protein WKG00_16685 [Polyangiaceae bacterium]
MVRVGETALATSVAGGAESEDDLLAREITARKLVLERRIDRAKDQLSVDIGKAKRATQQMVTRTKRRAEKTLVQVGLVAGGLLILAVAVSLLRRRTRRIRIEWR